MNILLIKPNTLRPQDKEGHFSSLLPGLLSIASHVRQPERLRLAVYPDDMDVIDQSLPWADAVGISAFTAEYEYARRLTKKLRELHPDKLYFLGGYHGTLAGHCDPQVFDFLVTNEGEFTVADLLSGRLVHDRNRGFRVYQAPRTMECQEIPILDYRLYGGFERLRHGRISLLGSRGCRYQACRFCTSSRFHRGLRRLTPERLAAQVELAISTLSPSGINLWDDNLSDDLSYLEALEDSLRQRHCQVAHLSCFARLTAPTDPAVFRSLRRLGVTTLVTGLESGSQRILQFLKGRFASVAESKSNLLAAKMAGQEVLSSVMFGSPGETLDDMTKTIDLLKWIRDNRIPGRVFVYVTAPLPGTPLWDVALQRGVVTPTMDFDTLAFDRFDAPLLLEPDVDKSAFAAVIAQALAIAESIEQENDR